MPNQLIRISIVSMCLFVGCSGGETTEPADITPSATTTQVSESEQSGETDLPTAGVQSSVIAIDILLEPDQVMRAKAQEANDRLRMHYPDGFTLDASHAPHITVVQTFIDADHLSELEQELQEVMGRVNILEQTFTANGYYYLPYESLGVAGITVERTEVLEQLQSEIIAVIKPFAVAHGTGGAFVPNTDGTPINQPTIDYVQSFTTAAAGDHYNPHVTIGLAQQDFLNGMIAEPFDRFEFKTTSLCIYHLGDFGTAQKKVWSSAEE